MRKCAKCGKVMMSDLRLKVNGGGYGIVVQKPSEMPGEQEYHISSVPFFFS